MNHDMLIRVIIINNTSASSAIPASRLSSAIPASHRHPKARAVLIDFQSIMGTKLDIPE